MKNVLPRGVLEARRGVLWRWRMRDACRIPAVKTEQEIKSQVSAIRERVKELSGFYIAEGAAMTYALEWALGKRETAPAGELGSAGKDSQKIADSLATAAEKAASKVPKPAASRSAASAKASSSAPASKKIDRPPSGKPKPKRR